MELHKDLLYCWDGAGVSCQQTFTTGSAHHVGCMEPWCMEATDSAPTACEALAIACKHVVRTC